MPNKYSESRTSSWAVSSSALTYSSYPHTHPAPSLLFTLPLSHKYSTVSFSYWKENHNFKTGFEPHTQPQKLLKLCGNTLLFAARVWEEAILWTACSVEGRHKITYCSAKDLKYPWCKQAAHSHRAACQDTASRRALLPCLNHCPWFCSQCGCQTVRIQGHNHFRSHFYPAISHHAFVTELKGLSPLTALKKKIQLRRNWAQKSSGLKQSIGKWDFSQNHRIIKVGRDLWRPSSPTPLPKQSHLKPVTQEHIQEDSQHLFDDTWFC